MQSEKQWDHWYNGNDETNWNIPPSLHSYLGYIPRAVHWKAWALFNHRPKTCSALKTVTIYSWMMRSNIPSAYRHRLRLIIQSLVVVMSFAIVYPLRLRCRLLLASKYNLSCMLHAACCMPYVVINEEWHSLSRQRYPYLLCSLNPWMKSSRNWFKLVYYMTFTKLLSTNFCLRCVLVRWLIVDTTIPDEDKASRCWKESSSGDCSE